MVLFSLLKTPEPSPEFVHSEMDYQSLNVSPFPQSKGISNNNF